MSSANLQPSRLSLQSQTRRQFLRASLAGATALGLSSCGWRLAEVKSENTVQVNSDTLYIYTWAGYTDDDLLNHFYQETGIKVIADVFDSNEAMLARLQAGGGGAYSVIYPSGYMVEKMVELKLLAPLNHDLLTGLDELFPQFQDPVYDPGNKHSVPLSWGATGFIYNKKLLETPPTDWDYLWQNQDKLAKRFTLLNDVREVMGATLKMLGYSYNATDPTQIRQAYEQLVKLKPAIASFTTDAWRSQMLVGDLMIAMCYSSDAAEIMPENEDLAYVTPESGSSLWTDALVIPRTAPNSDGAYRWINFMLQPDISKQLIERLSFATPSEAAYRMLSDETRNDPALFPPESVIAKSEGIAPLDDQIAELYEQYWTRLTSA
ncbi:MAG: ABC transporter substrate-binding protein [Microcoleaceae cyanobacterium]